MQSRKIFLDVGAYVGDTALAVLDYKYKFDEIYCFEPVSKFWNALHGIQGITVNEFGLWKETCTKKIYKPGTVGGSLFKDKFTHPVASQDIRLVKASSWFRDNIEPSDEVFLKLNCEGAECDIIEDLLDSGEYKKIGVLMVDFDVRKIPTQRHREWQIRDKLKVFNIPVVFFVERKDWTRWNRRHADFTHYWLDITTKELTTKNEKESNN